MHIITCPALRGASPETCRGRSSGEGQGRRCGLVVSSGRCGETRRRLMRRSRARLVTPPPGGPGQPSAGIMTGCLEWLHVDDDEGAMATAPDEVRIEDSVVARKHGSRGHKTPQVERREAPRARSQGPRRRLRTVSRAASPAAQGASQAPASAGAPLPSGEQGGHMRKRACPGPTKECGRRITPA
jgi:hypothetical protein